MIIPWVFPGCVDARRQISTQAVIVSIVSGWSTSNRIAVFSILKSPSMVTHLLSPLVKIERVRRLPFLLVISSRYLETP
jgi:hypothetical protein